MRYNPATDRARNIDEIAAECRAAITKRPAESVPAAAPSYAQLLRQHRESVRAGCPVNRSWEAWLEVVTARDVALAMGNWAEYRRLRATLIAGLF